MADFGLGINGNFASTEPNAINGTANISITDAVPVVIATIDFSSNSLVFPNSQVWMTANVGWRTLTGGGPVMRFSIFDTDPTTPGATPIYQTINQADQDFDFNNRFNTFLTHVDTPAASTPVYFLTADNAGAGEMQIVGPIVFTAAEFAAS